MSYNLTTMQSIYHNQDEIVEITYDNSPVYQKSGPTPPLTYDIRYTTTNNQRLSLYSSTGVVSHTFENNVGYITLDSSKTVPYRMFNSCTTLHKIYYSAGVTFSADGYQHADCTSLDYIQLPSDLTTIVQRLVRECTSLMSMTIPASVTSIGAYPWWHSGLGNHTAGKYQTDVTFLSTTPPVATGSSGYPERSFITDDSATQVRDYNVIYKIVPCSSYNDYLNDSTWSNSNLHLSCI